MFIWRPNYAFSKHLILCDPENIDLEKFNKLLGDIEDQYRIYFDEISEVMMKGIREFYSNCKNYEKIKEIVLKFEIYSRMLRWIITKNNPRHLQVKFDDFREAVKQLWIYLFGENFHEFWTPLPNKRYYFDRKIFNKWLEAIQRK